MKSTPPAKKRPEDLDRNRLKEIDMSAVDWEEFTHGVQLFNSGKFWNSHEAWEQVWIRHDEDERLFFQGLIQLAAAYHQLIVKKNYRGLLNNFDKAYPKLEVFQPKYLGVHVLPLLRFIEQGKKEVERLGPDGLEKFNYNLIPKLQFHKRIDPDFLVEAKSILASEQFHEGLRLFNDGYYWEAHEIWEEVWREEENDAKTFTQAFVQLASANSFVKTAKLTSAKYLFEKALEKFRQFENLECDIEVQGLIGDIERVLERIDGENGNASGARVGFVTTIRTVRRSPTNGKGK
jgi:hypothetical protein